MTARITLIAAVGPGGELGGGGNLAYSLRDDMAHFKATTTGHPVVMGRKTFESFPRGPLPGRTNIIVSRRPGLVIEGAAVAGSIDEALDLAAGAPGGDETFVLGGGQIYAAAMPRAGRLILTHVDAPAPAGTDTFFPAVDPDVWERVSATDTVADSRSGLPFSIAVYERRR